MPDHNISTIFSLINNKNTNKQNINVALEIRYKLKDQLKVIKIYMYEIEWKQKVRCENNYISSQIIVGICLKQK